MAGDGMHLKRREEMIYIIIDETRSYRFNVVLGVYNGLFFFISVYVVAMW